MIITATIFLVVFAITFTLCWLFVDEIYKVDLNSIIKDENLIWQDEFDGNIINTDNWRIEPAANFDGTKFNERTFRKGGYWTLDQCIVEPTKDGNTTANVLKIRTEKVGDDWQTAGIVSDRALAQNMVILKFVQDYLNFMALGQLFG